MNLLDRVHMGDIFSKYIPKFEYELVDLNQYSREDIIKFGNALSLILLIDKIRFTDDIELSNVVTPEYLEKLEKNIPEPLLPVISDCVRVFLEHIEAPGEEIERISESIYRRRLNDMFSLVDGYSVKRTREEAREEGRKEARKEMAKMAKEMAREMLLDNEPMSKIIKYSKLTKDDILEIEKTLR